MNLKSRDGSIFVYVLVFFYFFLAWFNYTLLNTVSFLHEQAYLKDIDKQLNLEYKAIKHLISVYPITEKQVNIDGHSVEYDCKDKVCYVYINGDINYSFIYDIIDE